jgi:hypothetical protein
MMCVIVHGGRGELVWSLSSTPRVIRRYLGVKDLSQNNLNRGISRAHGALSLLIQTREQQANASSI